MNPEFVALNPNKRMPVLEDDGFVLWESNAILHYLASKKPESGLWPTDVKRQADVLRWLSWEAAHWTPACTPMAFERVVKKLSGQGDPDLGGSRQRREAVPPICGGAERTLEGPQVARRG